MRVSERTGIELGKNLTLKISVADSDPHGSAFKKSSRIRIGMDR